MVADPDYTCDSLDVQRNCCDCSAGGGEDGGAEMTCFNLLDDSTLQSVNCFSLKITRSVLCTNTATKSICLTQMTHFIDIL